MKIYRCDLCSVDGIEPTLDKDIEVTAGDDPLFVYVRVMRRDEGICVDADVCQPCFYTLLKEASTPPLSEKGAAALLFAVDDEG